MGALGGRGWRLGPSHYVLDLQDSYFAHFSQTSGGKTVQFKFSQQGMLTAGKQRLQQTSRQQQARILHVIPNRIALTIHYVLVDLGATT